MISLHGIAPSDISGLNKAVAKVFDHESSSSILTKRDAFNPPKVLYISWSIADSAPSGTGSNLYWYTENRTIALYDDNSNSYKFIIYAASAADGSRDITINPIKNSSVGGYTLTIDGIQASDEIMLKFSSIETADLNFSVTDVLTTIQFEIVPDSKSKTGK